MVDKYTKALLKWIFESEEQIRQRISIDDVPTEFRAIVFNAWAHVLKIPIDGSNPALLETALLSSLKHRKASASSLANLSSPASIRSNKIIEMDKDSQILVMLSTNGHDSITIITNKKNDQYKTAFARIKPFLIAKGRSIICGIMQPYKSIVKRTHTDGFILSEQPLDITKLYRVKWFD